MPDLATDPASSRRILRTDATSGIGCHPTKLASVVGAQITAVTTTPERGGRLLEPNAAEKVTDIEQASGPHGDALSSANGGSLPSPPARLTPEASSSASAPTSSASPESASAAPQSTSTNHPQRPLVRRRPDRPGPPGQDQPPHPKACRHQNRSRTTAAITTPAPTTSAATPSSPSPDLHRCHPARKPDFVPAPGSARVILVAPGCGAAW